MIHRMNADGSNVQALTPDLTQVGIPIWSPDGAKIGVQYMYSGM